MSNYFQDSGYKTHLVGKWHLGFFEEEYLPNNRGFDSHLGHYNGWINYYEKLHDSQLKQGYIGYDLHKDGEIYKEDGEYVTDVYTKEAVRIIQDHNSKKPLFLSIQHLAPHIGNYAMEAPQDIVDRFKFINDTNRQHLAGKYFSRGFKCLKNL